MQTRQQNDEQSASMITRGLEQYDTILDVMNESFTNYASNPAFTNLGHTLSFADVSHLSARFAAWIQNKTDLVPGDRIIIQMPNLLQYPIVVLGALRAGLVVVNTNPLYTARELEHQINDSGAKAMIVLANMANVAQDVLPRTSVRHVIVTEVGDMLPMVKRFLVNNIVKHVKKMVPEFNLPGSVPLTRVMKEGADLMCKDHQAKPDDIALLQYTGGTTGVAKGAMLTHRNIIANMLQTTVMTEHLTPGQETMVAPLPLYHIYSFTVNCMVSMLLGFHNLLITNPRDMSSFIRDISKTRFSLFVGLNTLFAGLLRHPRFKELDFSNMKVTFSGGMALQRSVANDWQQVTGCKICEGFGMTETSPIISANRPEDVRLGTVGLPLPATEVRLVDEEGNVVSGPEAVGELCVKGPQVMKGYWKRPEATADILDQDGWLRTGDVAQISDEGFIRIVDRKKDMIVVSGFNVYPNELEDVLAHHPGVHQCAAIGIPSNKTGEAIKLFIVRNREDMTEEEIMKYLRKHLTGYKVPRLIEFRDSLPTSPVGKVLKRELRAEELGQS
ncbi:AMP-binding protein [Endozoicomonadaceae bacterium StTr2]